MGLVYSAMALFKVPQDKWDETLSEACEALMRCVQLHDPNKGRLSTYAYWAVRHRILKLAKYHKCARRAGCVGFEDDIGKHAVASVSTDNAEEAAYPDELIAMIRDAMSETLSYRLGERDSEIMLRRFGFNGFAPQTLVEISMAVGISKQRVAQVILRRIVELRKRLGVADEDGQPEGGES